MKYILKNHKKINPETGNNGTKNKIIIQYLHTKYTTTTRFLFNGT